MTSEGESHKTTEFVRRRKLRLQQVREQSRDIAKIIRQRAKVEKLRQVVELDANKEKNYLHRQEKVVKKLEELYSNGLRNLGTSHKEASGLKQIGNVSEKTDLSQLRGKEAAAELKRSKQQKLDEQKKLLDRKIQAREAANVISREKSTIATTKLSTKSSSNKPSEETKTDNKIESTVLNSGDHVRDTEVTRNDMATQWDAEILPHEWEPNIPALVLPKDDSNKETLCIDSEKNTEKKKRPNLFALSDEMPSSLRGNCYPVVNQPTKPSLTLVSEYIQNRALRLRETPVINTSKNNSEDLQNLKQTILRMRSSRTEGSAFSNICHVLEGQVIPAPTWHAAPICQHHSPIISHHKQNYNERKQSANVNNSQINKSFSSDYPLPPDLVQGPVIRRIRPLYNKYSAAKNRTVLPNNEERPLRGNSSENSFAKRKSVTMYNHSTKDTKNVPLVDERVVTREMHPDKDAYSAALGETDSCTEEKHSKKVQEMTSKIAMTRQNVEKEYKDTMAFLKGLPKNKGQSTKPMKNAYKDDYRLHQQKESRQKILQQEFKNVKIEVSQQRHLGCKSKSTISGRTRCRHSKSPTPTNVHDHFNERDFQYSWMPVPESDGNLAVHTIPTNVKEGKSGNNVKFSKVDSYHEYRSRHKHTPPTKDTSSHDKKNNKRVVEAVIIQQKHDDSSSGLSIASDNSSADDITFDSNVNKNNNDAKPNNQLTDAERIIIYKILDNKNRRNDKIPKQLKVDDVIRPSDNIDKENMEKNTNNMSKVEPCSKPAVPDDGGALLADELGEGIYKIDTEKGDNLSSKHLSKDQSEGGKGAAMDLSKITCSCHDKSIAGNLCKEGPSCRSNVSDDIQQSRKIGISHQCNNKSMSKSYSSTVHPSANTSVTSFKTATNVTTKNKPQDGEYMKLIDEDLKEKGNFYIGATGFLKDDAYEVVIQLRKKDRNKEEVKTHEEEVMTDERPASDKEINTEVVISASECKEDMYGKPTNNVTDCYLEPTDKPQTSGFNRDPDIELNASIADSALNMNKSEHYSKSSETNNFIPMLNTQCAFTMHDRSVITPFRDSYAIPCHVPKTDALPRPATSSYTQTTLSSPNIRPVFIHMSSSTSTAYMSPPEVVLPTFFRRGYDSCNEARHNADLRDRRHKFSRPKAKTNSEEHSKCRCRRCLRATNSNSRKIFTDLKINQTKTPPNTARSFVTDMEYDSFNTYERGSLRSSPSIKQCRRCHNCKTRGHSKLCFKQNSNKNKYQALPARNTRSAAAYNRKKKIYLNTSKNTSQSYLNPMIKTYIRKLLSLNREGIKAIQVMNQECSSVNTPASSIINVPRNTGSHKPNTDVVKHQISLEQIKNLFRQQLLDHNHKLQRSFQRYGPSNPKAGNSTHLNTKFYRKSTKKKNVHKVKSLNISKKLLVNSREANLKKQPAPTSDTRKDVIKVLPTNVKSCSQSLHSSGSIESNEDFTVEELGKVGSKKKKTKKQYCCQDYFSKPITVSSSSNSTDNQGPSNINENRPRCPINTSTQTGRTNDDETNFMKLAEDKLHNMEKIADLTEKCTKRLSNLAKVLEEVRKNKSLAYSQISTSDTTDSDQRSDKVVVPEETEQRPPHLIAHFKERATITDKDLNDDYESLLLGIPKPGYIESPLHADSKNGFDKNINNETTSQTPPLITRNIDYRNNAYTKLRTKPPPALLRMHLKRPEDIVVPHELSTVIEVDSPLSVKLKNQSSNTDNANKQFTETKAEEKNNIKLDNDEFRIQLDLSDSGVSNNSKIKIMSTDSSDESKLQMMDLNQFNDIMLRPFISLQEYAQEYCGNKAVLKRETVPTGTGLIEDVSSLHSDGSLPDVVAELLKRKVITEPFKFDTASNINSTTVSSESTLSVLALSRVRKNKNKSKIIANKENLAETSDTLSISSNPDLEHAFKKLGMGWASSTLKKTKERLALSSSSNTSSSSLSQFKFKNSNKQDMPTIVTDSVSSVPNLSKKVIPDRYMESFKNAQQQTSLTNSMTVKEFLNKELAKKITFTNKSVRNDSNTEFVSLIETKIPDELKDSSQTMIEENSGDSELSESNNRARTSTPVQIFKSVTYHSSSSSNISNGLFSNADDLSSVKLTSTSVRYHSASEKDELTIPNCSLKMRKGVSDCSKTDSC